MIEYRGSVEGLEPSQLVGFFEGWPAPPSPETHLALLRGSDEVVLALDGQQLIGFVTAITDGVLSVYIPFLEVRASHRGRGIGRELVRRLLARLDDYYMVDVMFDPDLRAFYEPLGFAPAVGGSIRRYRRQSGRRA